MSPFGSAGATIFLTKRLPSIPNDAKTSEFFDGENAMSAMCCVCPLSSARDAVSL